ncbi:MAG TPA: hypothetical protein DCZ94_08900 [Lentisphaeria bacterium]|nr:MAG: hypothetical protein A2X48_23500 [Lentisphaerae bacterium GWF2_49_21]HBC87058.1 hypothetical protein [Lentisphaeria bacterium]
MKTIDWYLLVRDIMELKCMNQQELAAACGISQQSVSLWKNEIRNPGIRTKQKLLAFARKENMDMRRYESDSARDAIGNWLEGSGAQEMLKLFELYRKMDRHGRMELLEYAKKLKRRDR